MKKNYKTLVRKTLIQSKIQDEYEIYFSGKIKKPRRKNPVEVEWTVKISDLFEDNLKFLVLSYLSSGSSNYAPTGENVYVGGENIARDSNFNWIYSFATNNRFLYKDENWRYSEDLILNKILHRMPDGKVEQINLPNLKNIFASREEMVSHMNALKDRWYRGESLFDEEDGPMPELVEESAR